MTEAKFALSFSYWQGLCYSYICHHTSRWPFKLKIGYYMPEKTFAPILVFLRICVFKSGARTGQKNRQTDRQTNRRAKRIMRPIGKVRIMRSDDDWWQTESVLQNMFDVQLGLWSGNRRVRRDPCESANSHRLAELSWSETVGRCKWNSTASHIRVTCALAWYALCLNAVIGEATGLFAFCLSVNSCRRSLQSFTFSDILLSSS